MQLSEFVSLVLHFQLLDNLLQLDLKQGGSNGSPDVDPGLRGGAASFKMVNFEVLHPQKLLNMV